MLAELKQHERAITSVQTARRIINDFERVHGPAENFKHLKMVSCLNLGNELEIIGKKEAALRNYNEALDMAQNIGDNNMVSYI